MSDRQPKRGERWKSTGTKYDAEIIAYIDTDAVVVFRDYFREQAMVLRDFRNRYRPPSPPRPPLPGPISLWHAIDQQGRRVSTFGYPTRDEVDAWVEKHHILDIVGIAKSTTTYEWVGEGE